MSNPILIIDNNLELELIEKQHPELLNAPLILLSSNFAPQQLELYKREYSYFDDLTTKEEAIQLSNSMHHLLWTWFIDENDKDLSMINGCSLGAAFVSSLENLFSTLIRYTTGLNKLLKKNHIVYFSSKTSEIYMDIVVSLQKDIGFTLSQVDVLEEQKKQTYGRHRLNMDAGSRYRDLQPILKRGGLRENLIDKVLHLFQRVHATRMRVMFVPGGKHESYFEYLNGKNDCEINWIIPFNRNANLFYKKNKNIHFYYLMAIGSKGYKDIKQLIDSLKDNIKKHVAIIDPELLIKVMDRHTFSVFNGAYNYYLNVVSTLQAEKPDLVILAADNYETFILAAQAAKRSKVYSAVTSHGLNCWGSKQYRSGRFKVFDYALAFGKQDADNYNYAGTDKKNIYITSFPYFERFLPTKKVKNDNQYKTALLLSPDLLTNVTIEKTQSEYKYYKDISTLLKELGIELIGIKNRHTFQYRNIGLTDNKLVINGNAIPLLSGYASFPDAVKYADFVIGPASTALIEAGLMDKDYYVYQHTAFHEYVPNMSSSLFDYVNGSFNMDQLRENIQNRRPYKQGCSVNDLIDLEGVKTKEDLYSKFESGIQAVLDNIETLKKHPLQQAP
ncbi:hypothetical protein N9357_02725 [bacterium]|nr:hypothetical protein [bacterium]